LEACYQGDVKRVKRGVANQNLHPIDPRRAFTDEGKNGIHLATISGSYRNVEIIRVLADYEVDINGRTKQELRTPLMLGAILGNDVAVEELLKLKAETTLQDY
jgi:ankyrin repeat protein